MTSGLHPAASGESQVWKLTGSESAPYKNERLAEYQRLLIARGITKREDLKLLAAQLFQENGALSEDRLGDHGCSFGIIQFNACVHGRMSAKAWLTKYPEWKSYRYQLSWMADTVADRFKKYHGNIKQVIVSHNRPASAARNQDTSAGYFKTIANKSKLFSL